MADKCHPVYQWIIIYGCRNWQVESQLCLWRCALNYLVNFAKSASVSRVYYLLLWQCQLFWNRTSVTLCNVIGAFKYFHDERMKNCEDFHSNLPRIQNHLWISIGVNLLLTSVLLYLLDIFSHYRCETSPLSRIMYICVFCEYKHA